jgi:hypothetical protein
VIGLRNLVLALALANLGVLAVFAWVVDRPAPAPKYDGPGITLLRELDPNTPIARSVSAIPQIADSLAESSSSGDESSDFRDDANADNPAGSDAVSNDSATLGETPVPPEPISAELATEAAIAAEQAAISGTESGRCVSIGPFPEDVAAAAFDTLVEAGFEPLRAVRESEVWDGYWVYIGQVGDLTAARAVQAELAANGLSDTQIVSTAGNGNLLSLGVFSEITRAGAQAERVNRIGYEATIADNLTQTETQWLDVTLTSEQSLALDMLQSPGQISRLEVLDCEPAEDD